MNDMKIQNFDEMFSQLGLHRYREGGKREGNWTSATSRCFWDVRSFVRDSQPQEEGCQVKPRLLPFD